MPSFLQIRISVTILSALSDNSSIPENKSCHGSFPKDLAHFGLILPEVDDVNRASSSAITSLTTVC